MARKQREASPWDPAEGKSGYGKHEYHKIDPITVNPEDYARNLHGEEEHFGDVREYNCADNSQHPDNDMTLDWLSRIGTEFEVIDGPYKGKWKVTALPKVSVGVLWIICGDILVPAVDLGVVADETNKFRQVVVKLKAHGVVDREQRIRLTKQVSV